MRRRVLRAEDSVRASIDKVRQEYLLVYTGHGRLKRIEKSKASLEFRNL